jgi:hypothetical protein
MRERGGLSVMTLPSDAVAKPALMAGREARARAVAGNGKHVSAQICDSSAQRAQLQPSLGGRVRYLSSW